MILQKLKSTWTRESTPLVLEITSLANKLVDGTIPSTQALRRDWLGVKPPEINPWVKPTSQRAGMILLLSSLFDVGLVILTGGRIFLLGIILPLRLLPSSVVIPLTTFWAQKTTLGYAFVQVFISAIVVLGSIQVLIDPQTTLELNSYWLVHFGNFMSIGVATSLIILLIGSPNARRLRVGTLIFWCAVYTPCNFSDPLVLTVRDGFRSCSA